MSGRERSRSEHNVVTLGPQDQLIGSLHIDGDLNVFGNAEGDLHATGDVMVESDATVAASIEGRNINVRGQVKGDIVSSKRLLLSGSGSLHGNARVGRLVVEDGASFNGSISMTGSSDEDTATEGSEPSWVDTETLEPAEPDAEGAAEIVAVSEGS